MSNPNPTETGVVDYDAPDMIDILKQTVAQGATPAEFAMFVQFCKATGLNPFKKEIWFIKISGRVQMMTSAAGFFCIANNNPVFDGFESGLVAPDGSYRTAAYPQDDFIGAWCKVYRKDRGIPTEAVAMRKEYDKKQSNWITMPRVMIIKCAESLGLRKTFPQQMNGIYTAEEMPVEYGARQAPDALPEPKVKPSLAPAPAEQDNDKQLATRKLLAENGETYQYDLHGIGNTCTNKLGKTELWAEIKALGGVAVGKVLHSAEDLPDFDSFNFCRPASQEPPADDITF